MGTVIMDDYYGLAICEFDAVNAETGHFATLAHTGDVTTVRVHEAPIMDVSEKGSGS